MSDLISRQAAIDALENDKAALDKIIKGMSAMDVRLDAYVSQRNQVVYDIYAIEQLPPIQPVNCSEFPNNSDVVDRQKAKNAICNACGKIDCDEMDTCEKLDIPSEGSKLLQPWEVLVAQAVLPQSAEPKRGRWIKLDMHRGMADHKCTACEQECYVPTCMGEPMYAYCPNCGAKMEVNNESN